MLKKERISKGILTGILFILLVLSTTTGTNVSATSWAELDPQEVSDRAEVIVLGTYDFSSKPQPSDFIFQGRTFNVKNVYKGEASKSLTAGIDSFDVGWAEEFQNDGGEFLLFLEKSENANFLVPVAGPNGMIQVSGGKVVHYGNKRNSFYEKILKAGPIIEYNDITITKQNSTSNFPLYVGALV